MRILFGLVGMLSTLVMAGQTASTGTVSVSVTNEQHVSLENATIELLSSKDSILVKAGIADRSGRAEFENIAFNSYLAEGDHG